MGLHFQVDFIHHLWENCILIIHLHQRLSLDCCSEGSDFEKMSLGCRKLILAFVEENLDSGVLGFAPQRLIFKDQFQWFLGFGLFFLFLDLIVYDKKTFWIERLNLFNENGNKN